MKFVHFVQHPTSFLACQRIDPNMKLEKFCRLCVRQPEINHKS